MSKWNDPPTTLTSFGPLSSDVPEGNSLFSRLWKKTRRKDGSKSVSREASSERLQASDKEISVVVEEESVQSQESPSRSNMSPSSSRESRAHSVDDAIKPNLPDNKLTNTTRTLTGVLNRLSSIIQTGTPQTYKDSDFKQYWMPDESCKECYDCGDKFTTFRRRHHCRICGQIFCSKCCNQELQGRIIGYKGGIRVCTYCGKVAISALQSEPSGNISVDKDELDLSLEGEPQVYSLWGSAKRPSMDIARSGPGMTPSTPSIDVLIPFDLTESNTDVDLNTGLGRKFLEDSVQLREIWRQIMDPSKGVEMQSHRIRLKTYYKCIVGNKLVDWLLSNDKADQRMQAVVIGQALLDAGFLDIIGQQNIFQDNFTLYKPSDTTPIDPPDNSMTGADDLLQSSSEPQWLQEIDVKNDIPESFSSETDTQEGANTQEVAYSSTFYVPFSHTEEKDFEPLPRQDSHSAGITEDIISVSMFGGGSQGIPASKLVRSICWRNSDSLKEDNGERKAYTLLKKAHQDHWNGLVQQMLFEEGLSKSWIDIVLGTAQRVSNYVRPDVREEGDDMNILKYIKFKKIPGETKEQTYLVHGVVFTRNIAHKKMAQKLVNPYILLLKGSIEYQRVENKFSSLEPQILQEEEFLRKNVKKISSLHPKPNIVIVEKSVSRLAQNYLLEKGITLVYNVKLPVMERIERLTQGSIVPSIDGIVSGPITLGFCHNFNVCHFTLPSGETKTLLSFNGCAQHLGCTIVLRGGSRGELSKIKKIMKQMITACYNSQLEISYCMDEFAMPESRTDDTITENESVMNFTGLQRDEHVAIKVSEYLYDPKSAISLFSMDQNGNSENGSINSSPKHNLKEKMSENICNTDTDNEEVTMRRGKPVFDIGDNEAEDENPNEPNNADNIMGDKDNTSVPETEVKIEVENSYVQEVIDVKDRQNPIESAGTFIPMNNEEVVIKRNDILIEPEESKTSTMGDNPEKMKRQSSGLTPLNDQSDPLHIYQKNQDDAIFSSSETLQEKTQKRFAKFKSLLYELYLSMSPYIKFEVPYLDTQTGSSSIVRKFFPDDLYWSKYFETKAYREKKRHTESDADVICKPASPWAEIETTEPHPLILTQIVDSLSDKKMQHLIADFRARGGRIKLKPRINATNDVKQEVQQRKSDMQKSMVITQTDCLDYSNHQRFTVLLSSHSEKSTNYPNPCVPPQLVSMPFYGAQDITLGDFLEKFCFRESYCCQPYKCPSENCDIPLLDHVRRIVHDHGSIFISLRKLTNCVPGGDKDIMMWNWCRKCRQATPLAAMSNDTWSFSFAKFLEFRFYVNTFTRRVGPDPCSHSLHHSFSQYFGSRNIVATFKYMPVIKKEIVLPPSIISIQAGIQSSQWTELIESMESVEKRGLEMYSAILKQLVTVKSSNDELSKMVDDLTNILESEKHRLKELIHQGRLKVIEKMNVKSDNMTDYYGLYDESIKMKRFLADADINWRSKMQELYSQHKKTKSSSSQFKKEKDVAGSTQSLLEPGQPKKEKDVAGSSQSHGEPVLSQLLKKDKELTISVSSFKEILPQTKADKTVTSDDTGLSSQKDNTTASSDREPESDLMSSVSFQLSSQEDEEKSRTWSGIVVDKSEFPVSDPVMVNIDQTYFLAESGIYSVTPGLAAGFQDPKQNDSDKTKTDQISCQLTESVTIDLKSDAPQEKLDADKKIKQKKDTNDTTDGQQGEKISDIMKQKISNFLSGGGLPSLPFPFDCREHHLLPTCYKVPVVVYDQEPSSIIAYALSSYDYQQKLQEIQSAFSTSQRISGGTKEAREDETGTKESTPNAGDLAKKTPGNILSFVKNNKDSSPKLTKLDAVRYNAKIDTGGDADDESFAFLSTNIPDSDKKSGKQTQGPHIELQYSDHMAKFYCKIYFAEQFRKLRKLIFPAGEERFIRSLSRCKMWEAKGGKSGSKFCKTDDQRFILKQMSGAEIDVFEKFGPEYFTYMSKSYLEQKPTALGKIVGVYRIGFRNTQTNAGLRQDLLVMENLFYGRKISQTFDLKGSERNRLAATSGKRDEEQVLLDTNLLNLSIESPLYIYPHSKTLLMSVISRDSQFLSTNLVMDYSLLVGLDENKNELVLGMIDYIRTFTWDKKLETIIKSAGGKLPTVVSPDIYRTRFLSAMTRYFLPVPDLWTGKDFDPVLS